jgi:pimeloyl-ACP methyl ester carboxylesterase
MFGTAWKSRLTASLLSLPLVVLGCVPAERPLPSADEIRQAVSYTALQPATTCAELRDDFGLDTLPLADTPDEIGIAYEEYHIPTPDGESLRVWHMPIEHAAGTVIVSPGNSGSMACYLLTAQLLTDDGYSAVLYDYEGFGGSSGQAALETLKTDLETVLAWTLAQTGAAEVTLFGMSLGSIPTVAVAIERPDVVNAVVLDSPVALGLEIERFGFLVRGRSAEIIAVLETWLLTEQIIAQMYEPLLIYMDGKDPVTPPAQVAVLLERAPGPIELVYFDGLGHAAGQFERTEEYSAHLAAFLTHVWKAD